MSCLFCKSSYHPSQFCNKNKTDISRLKFLKSKKYCKICLAPLKDHIPYSVGCLEKQKCLVCFSTNHHSVFCPDRDTAPSFFAPNIDRVLLKRFIQTFKPLELFLFCLQNFEASKMITLKYFAIIDNLERNYDGANIVKKIQFVRNILQECFFSNSLYFKVNGFHMNVNVTARIINLDNLKFTSDEFLLLFSVYAKVFKCEYLKLTIPIKFAMILKKAPNLDEIEIYHSDIVMGNTWPQDLLEHKNGKTFKKLTISLNEEFDIKKLVKFLKEKTAKYYEIILSIYVNFSDYQKNFKELERKLQKHFIILPSLLKNMPFLYFDLTAETDINGSRIDKQFYLTLK